MYTAQSRNAVAGQLFANINGVWNKNKPMLLALRLGLFNSTGVESSCLTGVGWNVRLVPDIVAGTGNSVELNDGCGWISMDAAKSIYQEYRNNWFKKVPVDEISANIKSVIEGGFHMVSDFSDLNPEWPSRDLPPSSHLPENYLPSAFQIRYRGFKGMLVVNRALTGRAIEFTESMKKFDSGAEDFLFIVGVSAPADPTILSSELITMFEGSTSNQSGMLTYLEDCLVNKRVDNGGNTLISLLRDPGNFLSYMGESEENIADESEEEITEESEESHFSQSKHFATRVMSLNVPLPSSAHVYGVADFSRFLKPNQVYLRISSCRQEDLIKSQFVVITKTPAMLKDHMRVFEIVHDCPQLDHLYDVLVFATSGCELVTKQLSGADLDGDHFYVFWDKVLLDLLVETTSHANNARIPENSGNSQAVFAQSVQLDMAVEDGSFTRHLHAAVVSNGAADLEQASSSNIETQSASKHSANSVINWSAMFECVQTALVIPANSFSYCSLQHLLCLRRLFVDYYGESWPDQTISNMLSQWISATFEAPKHGKWLSWKDVRLTLQDQQDLGEILKFPHFHPGNSMNTSTRISISLYGKLSDRVWNILSSRECWDASNPNPVVEDGNVPLATWIRKGELSQDVRIRSSTWVNHRSVPNIECFPYETIGALNKEGVVNWLILKAPINYAIRTVQNMRHVTHAISTSYKHENEMVIASEFEFEQLLEHFVASFDGLLIRDGVVHVNPETDGDRKVFNILHFAAHSLLTPDMYHNDKFLYPNLFRFMTELDYNPTLWTERQRRCIGWYCMEKWHILFELQDHTGKIKDRKDELRKAINVLRSLYKSHKFPKWPKEVDLRKRKRASHSDSNQSLKEAMRCIDENFVSNS